MNKYLSPIAYTLWLSIILFEFLACWTAVRRRYFNTWKAFSYYLFFMAAESVALFAIYRLGSPKMYSISYYIAGFTEAVLLSLVVLELLVKVLDPFDALPRRNIAWFCVWAMMGIIVSVAISISRPSLFHLYRLLPLTLTIQRTIFMADAAVLLVLLFHARSLGMTWKSSTAEIALAFVLYLSVQSITRIRIATSTNPSFIITSVEIGQLAYLCSLGCWIWIMLYRDPRPGPP